VNHSHRTYIVTGAAHGIGLGITKVLLERGASVVMFDLDGEALARETASLGESAIPYTGNVTASVDARAAVQLATTKTGRLDGLVNNAGIIRMETAWESDAASWNRHLEINVTGSFVMAQAVGEHLRDHSGGNIVNVASNAGKVGYPNMAAYNASKAAVISLTRSLAAEWAASNIVVNAVCPGGVDTPMLAGVAEWLAPRIGEPAEAILAGMKAGHLGRRIQPVEVGRVVAFLLSEDATIIRGQSINIDGGDTPY